MALPVAPAGARPGLQTAIQDDVSFIDKSPQAIVAAMSQVRALGIDRVRLSASWSSLTWARDSRVVPAFNPADPAAYEQARWSALDFAVRAAHDAGLKVMIDIAFWAPGWAGRGAEPRVRRDVNAYQFAEFAQAVARRYSGSFVAPSSQVTIPAPQGEPTPENPAAGKTGGGSPLPGALPGPPGVPAPPPPAARAARKGHVARGHAPRAGHAADAGSPDQNSASGAQAPGSPLPRVDMFTLWNEPNHPAFLMPQWKGRRGARTPASPRVYRPMVVLGYSAIKAVQPDATVLIGNTSSFGGRGPPDPVAPLKFLRTLACVNGRLRPLHTHDCARFHMLPGDGWAQHPYSLTGTPAKKADPQHPDNIYMGNLSALAHTLDRLVAMRRLAPGLRSIYITEYGYETHRLKDRPALSPVKQARYLTWGEYLASRIPNVKLFSQFLLRDQPPSAAVQSDSPRRPHGQFYSGLEYANGTPKLALRTFVAGLFAARESSHAILLWGRLRLGSQSFKVVIEHRSRRGRWRRVATSPRPGGPARIAFALAGQDSFQRYTAGHGGGLYRLRYRAPGRGWVKGFPVPPVARAG
ncbi:MAG TPA: hypothetical protein VGY97_13705 [Solirubrobacteraceae bacterium]|nr:hypothetical protein [Solirubrobacteraceae bacterium]